MKVFTSFAAFIAATILCVNSVSAEELKSVDNMLASDSSTTTETKKLSSSFELDYLMIDDVTGLGATLNLGGLVFTGEYKPYTSVPSGISNMIDWSVGAGLNKRIFLFSFLYIEGRIGAEYGKLAVSYDDSSIKSDLDGSWRGFANARAGIKLLSNTCINFGYKWKFDEFKFSNEYVSDYMAVGISFLF